MRERMFGNNMKLLRFVNLIYGPSDHEVVLCGWDSLGTIDTVGEIGEKMTTFVCVYEGEST
jgi:hypothetical protein